MLYAWHLFNWNIMISRGLHARARTHPLARTHTYILITCITKLQHMKYYHLCLTDGIFWWPSEKHWSYDDLFFLHTLWNTFTFRDIILKHFRTKVILRHKLDTGRHFTKTLSSDLQATIWYVLTISKKMENCQSKLKKRFQRYS